MKNRMFENTDQLLHDVGFWKSVKKMQFLHFLRPRFSRIESPIDAGREAWISWKIEETMEEPVPAAARGTAPPPLSIVPRPSICWTCLPSPSPLVGGDFWTTRISINFSEIQVWVSTVKVFPLRLFGTSCNTHS